MWGMWRLFTILSLVVLIAGLAGCAQPAPTVSGPPPLYVPFSVGGTRHNQQVAMGTAVHLLALPGEEDIVFGRFEKGYDGPLLLGGSSAYTEYTYDAYPIGLPNGTGYQYRYSYKSGVSLP